MQFKVGSVAGLPHLFRGDGVHLFPEGCNKAKGILDVLLEDVGKQGESN